MTENAPLPGGQRAKSIVAMVLGIYSIIGGWYFGNGLVFAIVGLVLASQVAKDGFENSLSKVGKITSIIGLIGSILGLIICIIVYAVFIGGSVLGFGMAMAEAYG